MIVSKTDNIPTKKIVTVLGKISTKVSEYFAGSEEGGAMQILIRKAKTMGADAIINFSYGIGGGGYLAQKLSIVSLHIMIKVK